jgi:hypothetical protein
LSISSGHIPRDQMSYKVWCIIHKITRIRTPPYATKQSATWLQVLLQRKTT